MSYYRQRGTGKVKQFVGSLDNMSHAVINRSLYNALSHWTLRVLADFIALFDLCVFHSIQ